MIIKIFISIIFIAELIIALALIVNMIKLSKMAQTLSNQVKEQSVLTLEAIKKFRNNLKEFILSFKELMKEFKRKQAEYTFNMIKSMVVYGAILLARGKYKKALLSYAIIKEIYEGFEESYS